MQVHEYSVKSHLCHLEMTVSSLGFQRLTSVRFCDWSLAHHPQNNPHSKYMKKVTWRTNKNYVVIADTARARRFIEEK